MDINQEIIDRAVNIATRAALNGHPVERVYHMQSETATGDPLGVFCVKPYDAKSGIDTPPWEGK